MATLFTPQSKSFRMMERFQRNKVLTVQTLLEGWSRVVRVTYEQMGSDASPLQQERDLLDRGHGVTVLLYNRARGAVLLLRQPRIIATLNNFDAGETLEACSGLMETHDPQECALREVEEETGHRPKALIPVGIFYASPGSSLELVHIFVAEYSDATSVGAGGGNAHEGEDIEVLETPVQQAMDWIQDGTIRDARTVIALQHFFIHLWLKKSAFSTPL